MKKQTLLPTLLLVSSVAAFGLRLLQNLYGFEPNTGLPIPGSVHSILLPLLLAVLAVIWFVLCRKLPAENGLDLTFPDAFHVSRSGLLLPVAGIFLMAVSGISDIALFILCSLSSQNVMTGDGLVSMTPFLTVGMGLSPRMLLILGVLTVMTALTLYVAVAACFRSGNREPASERKAPFNFFSGNLLLVAPVCLVIRLVTIYRVNSIDPSLSTYYVELLALVFLTLAFYRLSSFAFFAGNTRRFALYAGAAVVFCFATLADGHGLTTSLFYAGNAITLLGFLLPRLVAVQQDNE